MLKTRKEHLIELRDKIAGRVIEFESNVEYWSFVARHSPQNSQEIVTARTNIEANRESVKKDKIYLRCIDLMLKEELKNEN